jgi:hypothetical protein
VRSLLALVVLTSSAHADVISGVVRRADGTAEVTVDVYEQGNRIRTTTAGEDGRYTFDLPAGVYTVIAYTDEQASELRSVVVAGDEELAELALAGNAPIIVRGQTPVIEYSHTPGPVHIIYELAPLPTFRDRTHRAWVGMSSAADPSRAINAPTRWRRDSARPSSCGRVRRGTPR